MDSNDEQVRTLVEFFREHGKAIIFGTLVGVGGVLGWNYWQNHQVQSSVKSSDDFNQLVPALQEKRTGSVAAAEDFISNNKSNYGAMAAMELSKHWVEQNDLTQAISSLEKAKTLTKDDDVTAVINLRIARLHIEQNNLEQALTTLNFVKETGWQAEAKYLRGTIFAKQQNNSAAAAELQAALNSGGSEGIRSQIELQLQQVVR